MLVSICIDIRDEMYVEISTGGIVMDFSAEIDALIDEKQKDCVDNADNLKNVFRKNFDSFEKLVNFYKTNKKYALKNGESAYAKIQEMLTARGLTTVSGEPVSLSAIGNYMNAVRNERAGRKRSRADVQATSPHVLARQRVAAVSGETYRSKPETVAQTVVTQPGRFVAPEPVKEMANDSVDRLAREAKGGFVEGWTGQDEYFLMIILYENGYVEHKKRAFVNGTFWDEIKNSNYKFKSERYRDAARNLEMKLKKLGLW